MYKTGIKYLGHPQRDNSFNGTTRSTSVTLSIILSRHLYQIEKVALCKYKFYLSWFSHYFYYLF